MIRKAVILAAGRGTRMGDLTAELPKPMLPVQGRPMLEHILERLAEAGVEEYLLVVGYRREAIEQHLRGWPKPVAFVVQEKVDGTGSAARLAREFADEPFLLTFGDIMVGVEAYRNCARVLISNPSTGAVLGVKDLDDPWRGAAVYETEGRITRVIEKPAKGTSTTRWGSAGLYAMRPVVFDYLARLQPSARGEYELTSIFEMMLQDGLELRIGAIEGHWRDVGRPEDLAAVNRRSAPEPPRDPGQK